jgi:protein ImuA
VISCIAKIFSNLVLILPQMIYPFSIESIKTATIAQLQKDILSLQGFKRISNPAIINVFPHVIKNSFPNAEFPLGAVHEFISNRTEDISATGGFVSGVLGSIMQSGGASIWISSARTIFPPALKSFGIEPDKIIFIYLKKEKDILWAMEEALKCVSLSAVVGDMKELSFTNSRRLQLAVEQSRVTGFILRNNPRNLNTTACVTRWKITPLSSESPDDMPGVGFPRWNVELLKVRNGKPGTWQIEFAAGRFRHISKMAAIALEQKKNTG